MGARLDIRVIALAIDGHFDRVSLRHVSLAARRAYRRP
jgi:hypothetical protein